jgi:hypothetical protein
VVVALVQHRHSVAAGQGAMVVQMEVLHQQELMVLVGEVVVVMGQAAQE